MKLSFWKRKHTGEIISHNCYNKLTPTFKEHFEETHEPAKPTHKVVTEEDDGFATSMMLGAAGGFGLGLLGGSVTGAMLGGAMHDSADNSNNSDETSKPEFGGFGGGDANGGGSGGDWSSPAEVEQSSSNDNSSSFDSGSNDSFSSGDSSL